MGQGVASGVEQSRAAVEKATRDVAKARDKEADAAGKVRVAEQQLQALRDRGVTDAGRLAAAEERQATARRRAEAAARDTTQATNNLSEAERRAADAARQAGDATEDSGRRARFSGESFKLAATGIAAVGTAAVAAGKVLYDIGSQFDDMADSLRIGTGATGAALDSLTKSAKNVASVTPAMDGGMAQIGETMADLNTRLGLTGKPLETVTSQMIQLKNMGQEVDFNNVTGALTGFGMKGADASKALDELFRVSQSTGLSVDELAQSAIKGGPALRQYGYGIGDSAALIGVLDRSGLDADKTLAAMTKSLSAFAKEGKNPKEALNQTITSIDGFIKKGDQAGAINMASKLFGTRGAAQFVDAVKSGALSVEGLKAATAGTGDTILGAADDTADFAESWQVFKQKALLAVEPIASKVFGILSQGMGWIADHGIPTIQSLANFIGPILSGAFNAAVGFVDRFKIGFAILGGTITAVALPAFIAWIVQMGIAATQSAIMTVRLTAWLIAQEALAVAQRSGAVIMGAIAVAQRGLAAAQALATAGTIRQGIATVATTVASKAARAAVVAWAAVQWVLNAALNANPIGLIVIAIAALVAGVILAYKHSETFRNIVQAAWNGIKAAVGAVWGWFSGTVWPGLKAAFSAIGAAAMWLYQNAILPAWNGIQAAIGFVWGIIQGYFNMWMSVIRVLAGVVMWLWNNVVSPAFNGINAAAQFMWSGISTIFEWFKAGVNLLGSIVNTVVSAVIEPAWNAVKAGAEFMWGGIQQIFSWIQTGWNALGTAIRWVVDNVVKPAFDAIKGALQSVWDFFGTVVSGIGTAWDKLKGFVATPINFVINTVWNNGLLKAWNTIAGFLPGLKQMSPLAPVKFAEGGSVPLSAGAKRGKDSVHALLMPEEHVWDVNDVRKSGGQGAQYRMRQMVDQGKPFTWTPSGLAAATSDGGNIPRFADGGAVSAGDKLAPMPGEGGLQDIAKLMGRIISRLWSKGVSSIGGYRPPDGYNEHSSGRALDVMINDAKTGTSVKDFAIANSKKFPLNWAIWQQKMWYPDGRSSGMEDRGSPTQNHMDHDHLFYAPQSVDPNVVPEGLVTSGFGGPSTADMLNIIKKKITEIVDKALNPVKEGMSRVIGSPPPEWLGIPPKALDETKTKAIDTAFDLAGKLGDKLEKAYEAAKKITSTVTNIIKAPGKAIAGLFRDQGGFVPTGQSIVTNETGKPEAVLNWSQLNQVKSLMDKGASMSEAIAQVGAAKPQSDTIPADAVVLKDSATADEVQAAADKIKNAAEKTPDPSNGAGQPNTSGAGEASQPGKMKSLKELGQDAGGILAEGIGDFFGLPSWITDPSSAISIDKGENVRTTNQASTAGNSALTNTPETPTSPSVSQSTPQGSYTDPQYGDGSTVQQGSAPLSKMPDLGAHGAPKINYDPSKGAEQWRPLLKWAINFQHNGIADTVANLDAGVKQINTESSGNPRAVQQIQDVNSGGNEAAGLLQFALSTWKSARDTRFPDDRLDPVANVASAIKHYREKYGTDLTTMWGQGHGWKSGGYTGNIAANRIAGFVHGREFVVNAMGTQRNFSLLSAINSGEDVEGALVGAGEQWGSVSNQAARQSTTPGGGRTTNITVYGNTVGDIVQEISRNEFRGSAGYGSRVR